MPVKLDGLILLQCNENYDLLEQRLVSHYKKAIINNIIYDKLLGIKVLGSLNILGNPVKLFGNIQQGLVDAITKPVNGFIQGPLEGGQGLLEGANSLFSKTLEGTFNSVSKISGSLATGLGVLTLDQEYIKQRDELKNKKAKHIGQGLKQGGQQLFKGFGSAITGLIMNPVQQTEKAGVKGFFKGVFQGTTGLFIKPVNAILDFTSKAAEGIQNQTVKSKRAELRARAIRVFYGPEKFYKHYNQDHSEVFEFLQKFKHGIYKNIELFDIIALNTLQVGIIEFIIIGCNYIVNVSLNQHKLKRNWEIQIDDIQNLMIAPGGIQILLKHYNLKKIKGIVNNSAFVHAKEDWQIALIINRLEEIRIIKKLQLL